MGRRRRDRGVREVEEGGMEVEVEVGRVGQGRLREHRGRVRAGVVVRREGLQVWERLMRGERELRVGELGTEELCLVRSWDV